jgi:hypothetical protein
MPDFHASVRALYPYGWLYAIAYALMVGVLTFATLGLVRLFVRPPKVADTGTPWFLRARALYPWRIALSLLWAGQITGVILCAVALEHHLVPSALRTLLPLLAALVANSWARKRFFPEYGANANADQGWLASTRNAICHIMLRYLHLVLSIVFAVQNWAGLQFWLGLLAVAAFSFWFARGGGVSLARALGWVYRLEPAQETSLRERASVPQNVQLYGAHMGMANALAFLEARAVLFTDSCLRILTLEQLAAVLKHEIGHLAESPRIRRSRLALGTAVSVSIALYPEFSRHMGALLGMYGTLGGVLTASLIAKRILRDTEVHADDHASEDSLHLASALVELYRENQVPAVLKGKGGLHGHLYDRLVRLGAQPEAPRPTPPDLALGRKLGMMLLGMLTIVTPWFVSVVRPPWQICTLGVTSTQLGVDARAAFDAGDFHRATQLYGWQAQESERAHDYANLAVAAARSDCALAQQALTRALQPTRTPPTSEARDAAESSVETFCTQPDEEDESTDEGSSGGTE